MASNVNVDTEDLLIDGAIDQTFAFQRSQYIQLNAAKIELSDKLVQEVPSPEAYLVQAINQVSQERAGGNVANIIGNDQKAWQAYQQLQSFTR